MKEYILNQIKNSNIISEPDNILIIDNLFPNEIYKKIHKFVLNNVPKNKTELILDGESGYRKNIILDKNQCISEYMNIFLDKDIVNIICDKLNYIYSREFNFKGTPSTLSYLKKDFMYRVHTDSGSRAITLLFYTPIFNNESVMDGTSIYRYKNIDNSEININKYENLIKKLEINPTKQLNYKKYNKHKWSNVKNIDYLYNVIYKPNRLVIFQTTNNYTHVHSYGPFESYLRTAILFPYNLNYDLLVSYNKDYEEKYNCSHNKIEIKKN
jgi:hypothetical protein